jgi:hypothetical protein
MKEIEEDINISCLDRLEELELLKYPNFTK